MPSIFIKLKGGKVARARVRGRVTEKEAADLLDAFGIEFTAPKGRKGSQGKEPSVPSLADSNKESGGDK
jgi:hypothetical protein